MLREEEWAIEVMPVDSYHAIMAVFLQKWVISSNYPVECLSKRNFYLKKKKIRSFSLWIRCSFQHDRQPEPHSLHITIHTFGVSQDLWSWQIVKVWYFWCAVWWKVLFKKKKKASPLLTYTPLFQRPHRCSNYVLYRSLKIPFYSVPPFMWLCPSMSNAKYFHFLSPWFFFPLPPLRFKCRQLWQLNQQRPSVSPASWS